MLEQLYQASTTITGTYTGPWDDLGNGTPFRGIPLRVVGTQAIGTPNVLFKVEVSDDQSDIRDSFIAEGTMNAAGEILLWINTRKRYWRLVGLWAATDPGEGTGNSSSSSGQQVSSSSSGGSSALTFYASKSSSPTG